MPSLCVLCLAAALAAFARLAASVGPVVRCEPCDASALLQCKPPPKDCAERVREPGCGCCMTCALGEGQACGVYTARCGSGLTCQPLSGDSRPLLALLEGRGVCTSAASTKLKSLFVPAQKAGKIDVFAPDLRVGHALRRSLRATLSSLSRFCSAHRQTEGGQFSGSIRRNALQTCAACMRTGSRDVFVNSAQPC